MPRLPHVASPCLCSRAAGVLCGNARNRPSEHTPPLLESSGAAPHTRGDFFRPERGKSPRERGAEPHEDRARRGVFSGAQTSKKSKKSIVDFFGLLPRLPHVASPCLCSRAAGVLCGNARNRPSEHTPPLLESSGAAPHTRGDFFRPERGKSPRERGAEPHEDRARRGVFSGAQTSKKSKKSIVD